MAQCVTRENDLCCNFNDRVPVGSVLIFRILYKPHGSIAYFREKLVLGIAHDTPSFERVGAFGKPGAVHA